MCCKHFCVTITILHYFSDHAPARCTSRQQAGGAQRRSGYLHVGYLDDIEIATGESHSEEFYVEMAECSSSSKVMYDYIIFLLWYSFLNQYRNWVYIFEVTAFYKVQ